MPHDPYQHIAPLYDTVTAQALRGTRERIASLCIRHGFKKVLDIGSGTGILLQQLHNSGIQAFGLENSPAMLHEYRRLAMRGKVPASRCVQGNAEHPPFALGVFDTLIYALILHETDSNALTLLQRGLDICPHAVVLEWHAPERNIDYLCCVWPHIIERLAGKNHYRHYCDFIRRGGIYHLAHAAGANVLTAERLLGGSMILALLHKA